MNKYLITQSLLSSWQYALTLENGNEDFLKTLKREPIQQTKAMLDGIKFENVLNAVLNGATIDATHEWYKPIMELYGTLQGAQQQVKLSRDMEVGGVNIVLYGVLDFLKAGTVFDTKFSKTYRVGKYLTSPQHSAYLTLVPEAKAFTYLICDGEYIFSETYHPDETEPIERLISHFMEFLERQSLLPLYFEKWRSQY